MIRLGLRIKPAFGDKFDVWGVVTSQTFPVDGKIHYCNDSSYSEACVEKVYTVNKTAKELYELVMKEEGKQ